MENHIDLILRAQAGDRVGRARLLESHLPQMRGYLRRRFRGQHVSEDAMQEGAIAVLEAIRSFDPDKGCPFHAFANLCAFRAVVRHLVSERNFAENQGGQLGEMAFEEDRAEPHALPSLDCLSERESLVVELRFGLNGNKAHSFSEIAEKLSLKSRGHACDLLTACAPALAIVDSARGLTHHPLSRVGEFPPFNISRRTITPLSSIYK